MEILKYLKVGIRFFLSSIERYNNYKVEYLYSFLTVIPIFLTILFWSVIADDLEGWSFERLTSISLIFAIFSAIVEIIGFWGVILWFDRNDRANLTTIFSKPIDPLFYLHGINFFPGAIPKLIFYIFSFVYFVISTNAKITLAFIFLSFSSFLVFLLFLLTMESLLIAFDKTANPISYLVLNIFTLSGNPINLKETVGLFLTFVIPAAFVAIIPSTYLEYGDQNLMFLTIFMLILMFIVFKKTYSYALKKFEAVGG